MLQTVSAGAVSSVTSHQQTTLVYWRLSVNMDHGQDAPYTVHHTQWPCPVSKRLAKQKFSTWGFPINTNEAEFFFA